MENRSLALKRLYELKKIYYNLCNLKRSLYNINDFYKTFTIHKQYFTFEEVSKDFIAIHKRLKRTHSPTFMCFLEYMFEKAEKIVKNRAITKEENDFFKWIAEEIKQIKIICDFL